LSNCLTELEAAEPAMPLEDRAADTWEPLIAIADLAGGNWPDLARNAALALTASHQAAAVQSERIRLLTDCRTAFRDADALPTHTLSGPAHPPPRSPRPPPPAWPPPHPPQTPARRIRHHPCCRSHQVRRALGPRPGLLPHRLHGLLDPLHQPTRPRPGPARRR